MSMATISTRMYGNHRLDSHCNASISKAIQMTHTQSPYSMKCVDNDKQLLQSGKESIVCSGLKYGTLAEPFC